MAKNLKSDHASKNLPDASIPYNTTFTGDIETMGGVRVDGAVKGNVKAGGDITIGADGKIEGNVSVGNANIAGEIIGNLTSSGTVQMLSGSRLVGDMSAMSFAIEQGGYFKGQCMISDSREKAPVDIPTDAE